MPFKLNIPHPAGGGLSAGYPTSTRLIELHRKLVLPVIPLRHPPRTNNIRIPVLTRCHDLCTLSLSSSGPLPPARWDGQTTAARLSQMISLSSLPSCWYFCWQWAVHSLLWPWPTCSERTIAQYCIPQ
ncbi:hypothetical protein PHLGIDRAFT_478811 [Phlebiopsis gigantea 11061_1 CR5-6]|uniref:Uncharacterized protein n=1 Tax=Phlebiopsis gigantea (strain 11061_1 CR5-6) TaxID=745531 RepID=A0A0C3NLT0_PHLG1|nr:hypothetical protein PHLGIDRAFT_478811 [Phlebiopsis gigantea 11061_1 CR5-6]